jgi:cystathionine beta-lyase/cystathionine gamma-synthase
MSGFGAMISFETGSKAAAAQIMNRLRVFAIAESLGGVESLVNHPASMTHASVPPERRAAIGITEGLVRLSVGVEDVADLLNDLDGAMRA